MSKRFEQQNIRGLLPMLISLCVFLFLLCALCMGAAIFIQNGKMHFNAVEWIGYIAPFLASLLGNMPLLKNVNEGFPIRLMISAGSMILLWALISILVFDGLLSIGWGSALAILLGAAAVLVIPHIKPAKWTYKKYRTG